MSDVAPQTWPGLGAELFDLLTRHEPVVKLTEFHMVDW